MFSPVSRAQPPESPPTVNAPLPQLPKIRRPWNPLVFSEGYILGQIVKPTTEGVVIKFFNAEILLGHNSVPARLYDDACINNEMSKLSATATTRERAEAEQIAREYCSTRVNPFTVSSYNTDWQQRMSHAEDEALNLILTRGYLIHPFLRSAYTVQKVFEVNPQYRLPAPSMDVSESFLIYSRLHYGVSNLEGRIVMATMDGIVIRKRYHLLLQLGEGGGRFVHLDVPTRRLFDYIVQVMATGLPVRVSYYTLYSLEGVPSNLLRGYETNTRVYKVEVLERLTKPRP